MTATYKHIHFISFKTLQSISWKVKNQEHLVSKLKYIACVILSNHHTAGTKYYMLKVLSGVIKWCRMYLYSHKGRCLLQQYNQLNNWLSELKFGEKILNAKSAKSLNQITGWVNWSVGERILNAKKLKAQLHNWISELECCRKNSECKKVLKAPIK